MLEGETATTEEVPMAAEGRPMSSHRRVRNVGRVRFNSEDDFLWNRAVHTDGAWLVTGSPVDKSKLTAARLKRLFNLSWIVSTNHPSIVAQREAEGGEG